MHAAAVGFPLESAGKNTKGKADEMENKNIYNVKMPKVPERQRVK